MGGWQFWIDRGGTFTDVVARRPDGGLATAKLLSDDPEHYPDAALEGIRRFLGLAVGEAVPAGTVAAVKMGTTVATNALLERKGDRVVLVVTHGFADVLRIGTQNRPDLFARRIVLPEMLYERVVEAPERVTAQGEVLVALDLDAVATGLRAAFDAGVRSAAVVFLHGYRYPAHEAAVAALAAEIGFTHVSASHRVSPLMKLVARGDTTVVDAYVSPILRRYVAAMSAALAGTRLLFMQSHGGLTEAGRFQGKDSILSGPAGGVVGAVKTAEAAGFAKIIGFDMGGTSTDVCHYDGAYERAFETLVAGVRMRAPMMKIHTVAAGGGSVLHFDAGRFRVGPDSAGANPGPASYRRGGPLAVTDCNVMVGKLQPRHFPALFGALGDQPLDSTVVRAKFAQLAAETGDGRSPEEVADGFLQVAVLGMANAIKQISVQRGYDVTEYALCCFGGAGGQHACLVADALGMTRVFLHPLAGVLSAYGMGLADLRALREQAVEEPLDDALPARLDALCAALAADARAELAAQGVAESRVARQVHLRYAGSDTALLVDLGSRDALEAAFAAAHRRRFGFVMARGLVAEAVSVEAVGGGSALHEPALPPRAEGAPVVLETVAVYTAGAHHQAPVYDRAALCPGDVVDGPAVVVEATGTIMVEPGWRAAVAAQGALVLTRIVARPARVAVGTATADPVLLEVFNNLFMSVAEQMGAVLANTAHSVNIKERLDFSCAVFDASGDLVANAPHIPVHLGSMGDSVRAVLRARGGTVAPGASFAVNSPYNGGTHLPDITVVTPVFDAGGETVLFFVASRGHHADVGGVTPGSMPPHSTSIDQEGVVFDTVAVVEDGAFQEQRVLSLLKGNEYPARNPAQNLADLQAQLAANQKGAQELAKMVDHFGLDMVSAYMRHVQDNAEECVRRVLATLEDGRFVCEMDDGGVVAVTLAVDRANRRAVVDFSGSSPQRPGNTNAPLAVTKAAVLYVFRTLVDAAIPLNEGCLKPLTLIVPEGSMLNPRAPAAVVAGNVETSQVVVDALYGALGVMAAAQGTMNNLTFGDAQHQYYETICGGAGAGADFDGASAVHTHMTNSRLTDPEVLEWRYPVLVDGFRIRHGSGGAGRCHGGDGVVRRITFCKAMTAGILSNRRRVAPHGLAGGQPGQRGRNAVERADGRVEELAYTAQVAMQPGDVLVVETPGGGGFGAS